VACGVLDDNPGRAVGVHAYNQIGGARFIERELALGEIHGLVLVAAVEGEALAPARDERQVELAHTARDVEDPAGPGKTRDEEVGEEIEATLVGHFRALLRDAPR
jgi:hypothetical protein